MVARPCTRGREFSDPVEVPRLVLTFYYLWYGNPSAQEGSCKWFHWEGVDEPNRAIANSTNYPKLGAHDSHDPDNSKPTLWPALTGRADSSVKRVLISAHEKAK